ncbi:MAG: CotH kinase family protein [Opitutaceae bacterium]
MPRLFPPAPWKALLLSAFLPFSALRAATFTHNFNPLATDTPNGAINTSLALGGGLLNGAAANATLISNRKDTNGAGTINVGIVKTGVGSSSATALRLADKATGSATAALVLPVLDPNAVVTEFTVTLKLLMDRVAGAVPADGFNISFGPGLSGVGGAGGHVAAYGLVVNFDTYQNSTADPRSIEVFADANSAGNYLASIFPNRDFTYDQTFRTVTLHWDAVNGLDLTYDGVAIFTHLPTPGFIPTVGCNVALNAATGGLNQDVFIDDLSITTVTNPVAPIATNGVVIAEIMADNASGLEDEDLDRPDWIDLYNGTAAAVNISGWRLSYASAAATPQPDYTLPDLTLPAYGHQIIFASGKNRFTNVRPHANFTLQKEGGTLTLLPASGTPAVHTLAYGPQQEDVSFGGFGAAPGYLEFATPGATNRSRQTAGRRVAAPIFFKPDILPLTDQPSAVITTGISLGIQLPPGAPAGAEIRYTLNTAEPTETSTLYTGPLAITAGTCVKAKSFAPGFLPSKTGNRAFIWLSNAADTSATALINVANNYNASGQPFSSPLPVLVLDSYLRNVDGLTNPAGLRPYRFSQLAVYDVKPGTNRASLANAPDQMLRAGTHVRGESSSGQPQRPYALELWKEDEDDDRNEPLLGMPSHSDWILMSLYLDKSLMRNYLMQQAMLDANGPGSGVRCRFVEVFFNQGNGTVDYGDYRGVYLLMEKVSRGKERVDVAKLNDSMSAPELTSGGFIFKNDKLPYDYKINATSNATVPGSSRDYDIFHPEPVTVTQANALVGWLNRMTTALAAPDFNVPASPNYYGRWLHERSFIDKTLWIELCKEVDAYTFSSYFSKDRNGPMTAFPLWDIDRSLGNANYASSHTSFGMKWWSVGANYTYYTRLHQDPEFNDRYWNRWTELRRSHFSKDTLFNRIEGVYRLLTDASTADIVNAATAATMAVQVPAARHFRRFPILGVNTNTSGQAGQVNRTTWRHEVDALKSWLAERLDWIDGAGQPINNTTLAERLKPTDVIGVPSGQPAYGGSVPVGFQFRLHNPNPAGGTTYYTIDGADPRQTGGALDTTAQTATPSTVTTTPILTSGQTWKWLLPSAAPTIDTSGTTWIAETYPDTAWSSGPAPLGYGETTGLATNISPVAPNYTAFDAEPGPAFFRTTFTASGTAALTGVQFEIMADDGAGQPINTTTLAERLKPTDVIGLPSGQPAFGGSVPAGFQFRLHNPNPAGGTVHYTIDGADPRQIGGALEASALIATTSTVTLSTILTGGQSWKWLLPSAAPANDTSGAPWIAETYVDAAWSSGPAPLGYGEATGLATNISPVAPNYTAFDAEPGPAYFRTTFTASGTAALTGVQFEIMADDGAVVYLNGVEVARVNFPLAPTPATYGQEALGPIDPGSNYTPLETMFVAVPFDRSKLREGVNTLAVEVHQAIYSFPPNPGNAYPRNDFSDLRFDLRIVGLTASGPGPSLALTTPGPHTLRTRIRNGTTWSPLTEATFVVESAPASAANLVVSELHYHPPDPTPAELAAGLNQDNDFEFVELLNISRTTALDLSGVKLEDAVAFDFSNAAPALRYLPPGGRIVIVENLAGFAARQQPGAQSPVAGAYAGNFSNNSEQLIVRAANGALIRQFTYRDSFPWPTEADGDGSSLVLNDPFSNPDHTLASSWHASAPVALAPPAAAPPAPTVSTQPSSQSIVFGGRVSLSVSASGAGALWYQWFKDGAPIPGATQATLQLSVTSQSNFGSYTALVANGGGSVTSTAASVGAVSAAALSNLSVRATMAAAQTLTLGAVVGGGAKNVLIRAAGPALSAFGLSGLPDPKLELFSGGSTTPLATNDDWPGSLASVFASVGAFGFPSDSKDSALSQSLSGAFTVRASGIGAGVILVEAYDTSGGISPRLINVSARNQVGTGEGILIAGFAIAGTGSKQLLIRAVGPTLGIFGVPRPLADPTLRVIDSKGATVGSNDNWDASLAAFFTQVGAFPLPTGSRDAALLVTLPAGATYTVQVSGVANAIGEALVEIYEVF